MSGYQGQGGGGGRNSNYRGSGRGGSGGSGRGGRGGRSRGGGRDGGGGGGGNVAGILKLCRNWTQSGNCPQGASCTFKHVVQMHAMVDASNVKAPEQQNQNYNNYHNQNNKPSLHDLSSISIWEQAPGAIKIFTGSHDGFWRLWNTSGGNFVKEFESNMNGKVHCTAVVNNFLFCGFEACSRSLPNVTVGMVHAWNLQQPAQPPLELQMQEDLLMPYAAGQAVTAMHIASDGASPPKIASGSRDGCIRIWSFSGEKFVLEKTLAGHAREVTGVVLLPANHILWSCGTDGCIRIWDLRTGACQHCITRETPPGPPGAAPPPPPTPPGGTPHGVGHSHAVTSLLTFETPAGTFILSSSLDRTVKVWNAVNGECVASESHSEGIVCMSLAKDAQNNQLLLIGTEGGSIQCRNLQPTSRVQAFQLLFTLSSRFTVGHEGAVKCVAGGPSATFYSGGGDGKMMVFSFTGDLGLQ